MVVLPCSFFVAFDATRRMLQPRQSGVEIGCVCVCVMKDDAQTAQTLIFYLQDFTSCRRIPFNLQACRVDTEYTESTKQNINDFLDLRLSRLSTA